MVRAAVWDGFLFGASSFTQDGFTAAEADVGRGSGWRCSRGGVGVGVVDEGCVTACKIEPADIVSDRPLRGSGRRGVKPVDTIGSGGRVRRAGPAGGSGGRVRRAFYVQGWSVKKIVRELRLSRTTVRKTLRTDETDFSYERERQPMPRIGPWQGQLEQVLSSNAGKPLPADVQPLSGPATVHWARTNGTSMNGPAPRRPVGRRARSRTRSGWCGNGSSRRACGSKVSTS